MFDDLIPYSGATASAAPSPAVSTALASRPRIADYGGNFDNYHQAVTAWRAGGGATPGATPTPAPAAGGTPTPTPTPAPAPSTGGNSALGAFNTFYNSPAYQVPLNEGLKAVNTKYAALGAIESGAAMKAIDQYAAGHAASALGGYMDDLYRQEALGAQAASSLAGVGTNLVNQVSANNNAAGSAAGNAALVGGQSSANQWNNVGAAVGNLAGTVGGALGSSYGGGAGGDIAITNPALLSPQPVSYMPGAFY